MMVAMHKQNSNYWQQSGQHVTYKRRTRHSATQHKHPALNQHRQVKAASSQAGKDQALGARGSGKWWHCLFTALGTSRHHHVALRSCSKASSMQLMVMSCQAELQCPQPGAPPCLQHHSGAIASKHKLQLWP